LNFGVRTRAQKVKKMQVGGRGVAQSVCADRLCPAASGRLLVTDLRLPEIRPPSVGAQTTGSQPPAIHWLLDLRQPTVAARLTGPQLADNDQQLAHGRRPVISGCQLLLRRSLFLYSYLFLFLASGSIFGYMWSTLSHWL
jgi:hypothetical protein